MKIWWRQQEMTFAIAVFLFVLIDHLLRLGTEPHAETNAIANLFQRNGIRYDYVTHSLIPFLLFFAVPLSLLLLINGWILPRYSEHRHRWWIFTGTVLFSWLILTISFAQHYYLRYHYLVASIPEPEMQNDAARQGIFSGGLCTIIYLLYLSGRESVINWLSQNNPQHAFRVMVCNRITAVSFIYLLIIFFAGTFNIVNADGPAIVYIFIILPVIITCFINLYVLYPYQQRKGLPFRAMLLKLSAAPFVLSLSAWLFYTLGSSRLQPLLLPALFLIIMLLAIPLSWLIYIQQKEKITQLLQLERQLGQTTADLAFLRSQINPHFLFNTLNTLYGTALQENAPRSATGIQRLGDMMRFLLHENHRDQIPVSREIEYLQHYIALQSLRIAESPGIRIETTIDTSLCDYRIAPMLLIPFVENAFKHGIRLTKPSHLLIKFYCDAKGIYLDVVNSLHPKIVTDNEEGYSGIGMENVKQRLQLLYPGQHTLLIHQDDAAFQIHLHIQLSEWNT
jgi:two-component system LytT family sensor kinase